MKKVLILIIPTLFVCGCASLETVEDLRTSIDSYQNNITKIVDDLKNENAISESAANKIADLNVKIDELQPKAEKALEIASKTDDIVRVLKNANDMTAPINPYYKVIDGFLKLFLGILGVGSVVVAKKYASDKSMIVKEVSRIAAESDPASGQKLISVVNK